MIADGETGGADARLLDELTTLVSAAGAAILAARSRSLEVRVKADRSGASWITLDLPPGEHDISLVFQNQFVPRSRFRNATLYAWAMPQPVIPGSPTSPVTNTPSVPGTVGGQQGPSGPAVR